MRPACRPPEAAQEARLGRLDVEGAHGEGRLPMLDGQGCGAEEATVVV